jgi:hypothetical protein
MAAGLQPRSPQMDRLAGRGIRLDFEREGTGGYMQVCARRVLESLDPIQSFPIGAGQRPLRRATGRTFPPASGPGSLRSAVGPLVRNQFHVASRFAATTRAVGGPADTCLQTAGSDQTLRRIGTPNATSTHAQCGNQATILRVSITEADASEQKRPRLPGPFFIAGAGFEPATFGL